MSTGAAFDAKEQVRQAIDIVDVVSSYVQLRRQGRNFVGLCPWHDDSRPSLQVNPERQSFKCWVCDVGGDIFSFVMRAENLDFREALELLAERAGIDLRRARPSEPGASPARPENDKRTLYRAAAWAEQEFHRCLTSAPEGEPGRQYLAERGITPDTARRFHLGYAPDRWDWLVERARGSEWSPAVLERVGLVRRREGGGVYDWFRGRVMFSIRDVRSRPIAFGGRVLPQLADERTAKYMNSPDTPLFCKGGRLSADRSRVEHPAEFYGLDLARTAIGKCGCAVVLEGYTDVLMAHQNGIVNAIAVLGTAFGEVHVSTIKRYTDKIILVLDGDEAGKRRTNEILDNLLALFEKNQVDLRILTLPEGVDPCDFIATHGSDPFRQLLAQAVDALEHKFNAVTHGLDTLTDTHRASQAAEQLLATLVQIRPAAGGATSQAFLREEQMLSRIARKFHLPEDKLRSRLGALRREARPRREVARSRAASAQPLGDLPACDKLLLELLITHPGFSTRIKAAIEPATIQTGIVRHIYEAWLRLAGGEEGPSFQRLMLEFEDLETKNLLVGVDDQSSAKPPLEPERLLQDCLDDYRRRRDRIEQRQELALGRSDDEFALQAIKRLHEERNPQERESLERRRK